MKRLLLFFVFIAFCGTPSEKIVNDFQSNNESNTTATIVSETPIQDEISLYKNSIA